MVEFSSQVLGTINNKSQRNDRGKCLGWPVTSYGAAMETKSQKALGEIVKNMLINIRYTIITASNFGAEAESSYIFLTI